MLKKAQRADKKQIEQIWKDGRFIASPNLTFKYIKTNSPNSPSPQISFITPKTVSKSAVKRIALRRLGYLALGKYINKFSKGLIGAFIFKKQEKDIQILENEIKDILHKIN